MKSFAVDTLAYEQSKMSNLLYPAEKNYIYYNKTGFMCHTRRRNETEGQRFKPHDSQRVLQQDTEPLTVCLFWIIVSALSLYMWSMRPSVLLPTWCMTWHAALCQVFIFVEPTRLSLSAGQTCRGFCRGRQYAVRGSLFPWTPSDSRFNLLSGKGEGGRGGFRGEGGGGGGGLSSHVIKVYMTIDLSVSAIQGGLCGLLGYNNATFSSKPGMEMKRDVLAKCWNTKPLQHV